MSKFYTYTTWEQTFKPIKEGWDVETADPKHIWTEVQGDGGEYIIAGWHFVNRTGYYVTELPWVDEFTEVPIYGYEPCSCLDADEEADPDCDKCEGSGDAMVDVDNIEYLRKIYNNDPDIVA